jgi:hypothetical protein
MIDTSRKSYHVVINDIGTKLRNREGSCLIISTLSSQDNWVQEKKKKILGILKIWEIGDSITPLQVVLFPLPLVISLPSLLN